MQLDIGNLVNGVLENIVGGVDAAELVRRRDDHVVELLRRGSLFDCGRLGLD